MQDQFKQSKFTILLPPPNVTGSLHIGHYLNWSLQDLLMRQAYIDGLCPNWIVGTDHAGISAEYVVTKELAKIGKKKEDLSETEFIEEIWKFKQSSQNAIENQASELGFLMNWEKKIFTLDEEYQEIVRESFVELYNAGLIKKNLRITNWDVALQTSISDLEMVEKKEKSKIFIIEYTSLNNKKIQIATTRPETIFADTAIAVHPEDERFTHLHGEIFLIPLINRQIKIILEPTVEQDKGTGALKVTPACDLKDYEIGQKHNLECIEIINKQGRLFNVPDEFDGLTLNEANEKIVLALGDALIAIQDWEGLSYFGEKSGTKIITILTQQWFLDTQNMAQKALQQANEIEFIPAHVKNIFEFWMNNIKPWCISRQITWGHRIPVWYDENGNIICAANETEALKLANGAFITQETDVLDTWFSSALWPIATQKILGQKFEPTDILITGKDILFFWVARMIMFSLYFKNQIPFKRIYFNGIVRDLENKKMSKTRGNVLNPLNLQKEFGDDALRFALLKQSAWGKDIKIQETNLKEGRAFNTKLRNATLFLMNFMQKEESINTKLNIWIENQIAHAQKAIAQHINNCAFHEAVLTLHHLFWNDFCAIYIECLKIYPTKKAIDYLVAILKIAHPMLPSITQECFKMLNKEGQLLDASVLKCITCNNNFDKTIEIVEFLRKLKHIAQLQTFNCKNIDPSILEGLTKLKKEVQGNDFAVNFDGIIIKINSQIALIASEKIKKETEEIFQQLKEVEEKIAKARNVPEEILDEWQQRANSLHNDVKIFAKWNELY